MTKKLAYPLTLLGCVSVGLIGIVQANNFHIISEKDDVVFAQDTDFRDVACGGDKRTVTYKLFNNTPSDITLYNVFVFDNNLDNSSTITKIKASSSNSNCIKTLDGAERGQGKILKDSHCNIVVTVIPPNASECPNGPITQTINRELYIGVDTDQEKLTTKIKAAVTAIGSGKNFAVLSDNRVKNNDTYGLAQIVGDLGGNPVKGSFNVLDGIEYTADDHIFKAAQSDMLAAYNMFNTAMSSIGCSTLPDLANPASPINSGYYCLTKGKVAGTITLKGRDNFVFYGPLKEHLNVKDTTTFKYLDNASPDKVYWIVDGLTLHSGETSGAALDGTVLSHEPIKTKSTTPNIPAMVNGRLWSFTGPIDLSGNTIATHPLNLEDTQD